MFIDKQEMENGRFMSKTATIKDIAKEVGVSETTISRYLNGKFEYMSEKTRKKIEKAIRDLDYRPNHLARSLKSQKSMMIGAVIADISNPFSSVTIKGLSDRCEELGYTLLIAISDDSAIKEQKQIQKFIDNRVDGLIVNTSGSNEPFLVDLMETNLPMVLLDRGISGNKIDTVTTDNYSAVQQMMSHLKEQQYASVAFFVDKLSNTVRKDRLRGFQDAIRDNSETFDSHVYSIPNSDRELIADSLKDFKTYPRPRAIFCANGLVTSNVLEVIRENDYDLYEDFSICGFDDMVWSKVVQPSLTTISQDSYTLGKEAISQLVEKIEKPIDSHMHAKLTLFPGKLKIRESTTYQKKN